MKNLSCPHCGAPVPQKEAIQIYPKCEYCGCVIDLEGRNVTHLYDEAKVKQIELDKMKYEQKIRKDEEFKEQKENYKKMLIGIGAVFAVSMVLFELTNIQIFSTIFALAFIAEIVVAICMKPKQDSEVKVQYRPNTYVMGNQTYNNASPKSKTAALIICVMIGYYGIHYFYVGRTGKGLLYLFTFGLLGFGWILDIISIASGKFQDNNGRYLV